MCGYLPPMSATQHLTVNVKLRIDVELRDDLQELADAGDRKLAQEMRRGLRAYVEAEKNGAAA